MTLDFDSNVVHYSLVLRGRWHHLFPAEPRLLQTSKKSTENTKIYTPLPWTLAENVVVTTISRSDLEKLHVFGLLRCIDDNDLCLFVSISLGPWLMSPPSGLCRCLWLYLFFSLTVEQKQWKFQTARGVKKLHCLYSYSNFIVFFLMSASQSAASFCSQLQKYVFLNHGLRFILYAYQQIYTLISIYQR